MRLMPCPIIPAIFLILGILSSYSFNVHSKSGSKPAEFRRAEDEPNFKDCKINSIEARNQPWLGYLRISNSTYAETESDVYWPVAVIGPTTVLISVRAFRSLYYDRKLRIQNLSMYHIHLKDGLRRSVSSIQLNPGVAPRGEMCENWMKTENDIALVHLNEPISFSREIRRLCLPTWSQEWWDKIQSNRESFLEPGSLSYISGWRGTYDNAMQKKDVCLRLKLNTSEECRREWQTCWEYAEEEDMRDAKYLNRVCGTHVGKVIASVQAEEQDHGLFAGFFYFHIHIGQNNECILSGVLDGISHHIHGRQGPTAFVLLLKPSCLEWIKASMECGPDKYTCDNGECIDATFVCDQKPDCGDGSDENHTFCRGLHYCKSSKYECGAYGECLDASKVKVCDGSPDCSNGADEEGCPTIPVRTKTMHVWVSVVLAVLAAGMFLGTIAVVRHRIQMGKKRRYLTDGEIGDFRQGIRSVNRRWAFNHNPMYEVMRFYENVRSDGQPRRPNLMQMPFVYDIPRERIELHEPIGEGAFGVVFRATVDGRTYAVKALKPELVDKEMFKTFLAELKIMAYVNFTEQVHENVVRLLGADTEDIRNFELLVVMEYCEHRSISEYIRRNLTGFEEACRHPNPPPGYIAADALQTTSLGRRRLRNWALQIAEGMHFLASHKIIHGDLAARNVLLDSNLNAKISDFGLSRQIYYYNTSCAKICKNTLLPWRWMAPEVIESMKISSKSDVWSFGVTVWEIFSLGSVPYGGLEWNPLFVEQLRSGFRLHRPNYADDSIFAIIQECWMFERDKRPDFQKLRGMLAA